METIKELTEYVSDRAREYIVETGEEMERFPLSIVDFVIEHLSQSCHFPSHFTDKEVVSDLSKIKNTLVMACVEIYARSGAEGQIAHNENGISRTYDGAWLSSKIYDALPNYVTVL